MTQSVDIAVVRKSVTVDVDQQRAFEVFVTNLGTWWPGEYHIGAADMKDFVIEPKAGGRWYEVGVDGTECDTGRVDGVRTTRAHRARMAHHRAVVVRSRPRACERSRGPLRRGDADRTRVELEHRNLERHGDGTQAIRDTVDGPGGWDFLLPLSRLATAPAG